MRPNDIVALPDFYALSLLLDVTKSMESTATPYTALAEIYDMTSQLGIVPNTRKLNPLGEGLIALAMASHINSKNIEYLLLTAKGFAKGSDEEPSPPRAHGGALTTITSPSKAKAHPSNLFELMDHYNRNGVALTEAQQKLIQDQSHGKKKIIPRDVSGACIDESELKLLFMSFDEDGSGLIDREEFKREYKSFESFGVSLSDKEVDSLFSKYDTTKDGKLGFEEFALLMLQRAKY
eukprot:PhF_6_TR41615/c0_g1_i3/m.63072